VVRRDVTVRQVLHYGQKFSLVANSQAFGQPLDVQGGPDPWFVRSLSKSQDHYSKLAKHQEISATPRASYANVWQVGLRPPPRDRAQKRNVLFPRRRFTPHTGCFSTSVATQMENFASWEG
jgi:hypothetical protein